MNKSTNVYPCVVTIAGTDPSGGAGIQADIKAISATGCYAASVITALVAQNTCGVQEILDVPSEFVKAQMDSVFSDLHIDTIKIGMLHKKNIIETITNELKEIKKSNQIKSIVLDPVMVAKNGSALLDINMISFLKEKLFSCVDLITPNLFETEKLLEEKITSFAEMERAAEKISNEFDINVLIKGGHLDDAQSVQSSDVLYLRNEKTLHWFHAERIHTPHTHGTGCSLSSAIASYLAQQYGLPEAISAAKQYLTKAIQSGSQYQIGHGRGPVDHFYFLKN